MSKAFIREFARLQKDVYKVSEDHGFHALEGDPFYVPTKLALIASEVSEALEVHRSTSPLQGVALGTELADIVIRTMDLAQSFGFNLGDLIVAKHSLNKDRPYRHGKLY